MSNVKIRKAKIKDELFLEVEFTEELPGHSKKDTKMTCTVPVHDDLKSSFSKLDKYLATLCDEVKTPKKSDLATLNYPEFTVKGFTISGNDETEGVTINGYKDGKYGLVNLNTPFTKYEESDYPFTSELAEDIEAAVYEVELYLFEGKRAPEKQISMDFGEELQDGAASDITPDASE